MAFGTNYFFLEQMAQAQAPALERARREKSMASGHGMLGGALAGYGTIHTKATYASACDLNLAIENEYKGDRAFWRNLDKSPLQAFVDDWLKDIKLPTEE